MNIFRFELKKQITSFLIWTVAIVAVMWGLMVGAYPVFQESVADIMKIMEGFPPQFAAAFGMDVKSIFNFGGYYSFCFGYISLMGAIMATSIGVSTFAREKRAKCSDFLLTRPISRGSIFAEKLLSGLSVLIAANVVYILAVIIAVANNGTDMLLASLSLLFTQLVFFAMGIFYATFVKKVRSVSSIATAFGFGAFILSALVNILEEESLRFVAPLKYFDPIKVFTDGGYELKYAVTGVAVVLLSIVLSYLRFVKSDTKSI
ncbi:MAG: ABC transporter permease subunit [Clostridiaceae bacterium]|nr:ABC transporter permease subunit [Clostridiaceae bacterium]